ncbi:MAG: ATP-dependent helicase [Gemmatimonadota bacterium]
MTLSLNEEQRRAVAHGDGPLLVLAGAGSGKTRVLTARVAELIARRNVAPHRLLAVTFTNKAAQEMRSRIERLLEREVRHLWIGTFHAIGARLLRHEADQTSRDRSFSIYDEEDSLRTLKGAMEEAGLDPRRWSPGALRSRISAAKNAAVEGSGDLPAELDLLSRAVAEVYPVYQRLLVARNAYDFDDLILEAVRLLERNEEVRQRWGDRFLHVLVDEYQDTNPAQYRLVRALARKHGNLCVVGDDDQSIYGWRGADLRNILEFERDFPGAEIVRLEENYRSTASILEVANAVIACNRKRKPKRLRTRRGAGSAIQVLRTPDERTEAAWTVREIRQLESSWRLGQFAVLYRTNAQSRAYEEALRRAGLPYRIVGGVRFYDRREIKDVLSYLQLIVNPSDDVAFGRAVAWPRRGVGAVTLEKVREAAVATGRTLMEVAARASDVEGVPPSGGRGLESFAEGIRELRAGHRELSARAVTEECIARFELSAALEAEEKGQDRLANVTELVAAAAAFDRWEAGEGDEGDGEASDLQLFLQSISLRSEIDEVDLDAEAVVLMTLHNAKGLEFPVVFIGGLEEGLFPLARAGESEEELEEERRLFYVGVTRARERLYLTHTDRRWRAGMASRSAPSSFLGELPEGPVRWRYVGGGSRGPAAGIERVRAGLRSDPVTRAPAEWGAGAAPGAGYAWRHEMAAGSSPGSAAERPAAEGELRYDYADSQLPLVLTPGARIIHPRFGAGRIVAVSGEGRRTKAEIDFEDVGRKKVVVAHAGLRPA